MTEHPLHEGHEVCEQEMHPGAILVGGTIPAHVPGAYPTLSCCGGDRELVPNITTCGQKYPPEDDPSVQHEGVYEND